jgi:hypothetical protein
VPFIFLIFKFCIYGEVREWLIRHDWKSCVPLRVPWVRIPPSPLLDPACVQRIEIFNFYRVQSRRGAGVVERGGLENRCAQSRTVGSNPTLSAMFYTYILQSEKDSGYYYGSTSDLE